MTVSEILKRVVMAGLGVQEKAKEFVDELVKTGELSKSDAANLVKEWTAKAEENTKDLDKKVKDAIAGAMEKLNIPTREDVENIEKKLHTISSRLRKLEGGGAGEE